LRAAQFLHQGQFFFMIDFVLGGRSRIYNFGLRNSDLIWR